MNIFSVLGESDDDEQPKVVPQKKGKEVASKTDTAPKKEAPKNAEAPKVVKTGKENSVAAKPSTNAKAPEKAAEVEVDVSKDNNRGGLQRGKDPRKGPRPGRGEEEARPKKHENDRRSAGGRGRGEQAKGGRGSYGFGSPAQDAQEAEKDPAAADAVVESAEGDVSPVVDAEPEVPEPVTYTLDEFMAKRNEARAKVLNDVKPLREVKKTEFVGLVVAKEEDTPDIWRSTKATSTAGTAAAKEQRSESKTSVLDVGFKFEAIKTDRDDRDGGRGGRGDGGRGRGGPRSDRPDRPDRGPREGSRGRGEGRGGRGSGGEGRGASGRGGRGSDSATAPRGAARGAVFNELDFPTL